MRRPVEGEREDGERGDADEAHEAVAEEEALVEDGGPVECSEEPRDESRRRIEEPAGEPVDKRGRHHAEKGLDEDDGADVSAGHCVDRCEHVGVERILVEGVLAEPVIPESPADRLIERLARAREPVCLAGDAVVAAVVGPRGRATEHVSCEDRACPLVEEGHVRLGPAMEVEERAIADIEPAHETDRRGRREDEQERRPRNTAHDAVSARRRWPRAATASPRASVPR